MKSLGLLPILLIYAAWLSFWGTMLYDCMRNESPSEKTMWVVIIVCAPFGSIIYFFARYRRRFRTE